ncbi:MAG: hypothetical protein CM15mV99_090 [Caudoviricetes sp.]|nr:MAG: hypothetical protein CM15mV99_090 [Caudoviricetes sp.]
MSQIKLLHSGGNGVILSAPDSNPASDRTLKLPGDANSTVDTLNRAGNILQVVQAVKTGGTSTSTAVYGAISGLQPSITPSSTSNKILITIDLKLGFSDTGADVNLQLFRSVGGTETQIYLGDTSGNRTRTFWRTKFWLC